MIIENDIKLDFSDVLIKPKRSTLESRNDVNLVKTFHPKYGYSFSGVPIMAANMATGTYIGAESIKDFGKCATFVRVTHIHDKF